MKGLNTKYIPAVDELRAIAALLVLFFHTTVTYFVFMGPEWAKATNPLKLIVFEGHLGVSLFFVLSGFIFTWATFKHAKLDLKNFYINRFLRIYPLFILVLLVTISAKRAEFDFVFFIQSLLGFGNYGNIPFYNDFISVLWTIAVELQFYLLFPWLLLLLKKNGPRALLGIIAVLTVMRLLVFELGLNINDLIYWTLPGRLDQFLAGMLLAYIMMGNLKISPGIKKRFKKINPKVVFIGALAVLYAGLWLYSNLAGGRTGNNVYKVFWPTLDALIWAVFAGAYIHAKFKSKLTGLLAWVGMLSYSVYLLHWPIMKALGENSVLIKTRLPDFYDALISVVIIILPVVLAVAYLSYKYIESPFLSLRKKY